MAEYYGYAERDANAYVDWGKLGQNLTETVQTAYKLREERKAKLDEVMQKNYAALADAPSGLNQDINKTITSHVGNTKKFLLQANKMLKAGLLTPEDYTLIMQNQKEDNKAIFDNAKNWQTAWAKIQDDVITNKSSRALLDIASTVASFGKFKNTDFMINPVTGRVNAAKMNVDPVTGERTKGESMTMQQMNVLMNQDIPKYDITGNLINAEKALGENVMSTLRRGAIQSQGGIRNVTDKTLKKTFDAAAETFYQQQTANPFNTLSILMDHLGSEPGTATPYTVSMDENDRKKNDPSIIMLIDPDGDGSFTPDLTDAQKAAAKKYITDQFVGMIDRKEESQVVSAITPSYEPEYIAKGRAAEKEKQTAVGAWDQLRWGNSEEKLNAANTLLGTDRAKEEGLIDIDMTSNPGNVILKYEDSAKNRTVKITDNGEQWSAIGVELHGETDKDKAKKAAGGTWSKPLTEDYTGVRAIRQGSDYTSQMSNYVGQVVPESIVEDDYKATAANLNDKLKDLGFTVKGDYELGLSGASDYIIITAPDGTKSEKIYIDDAQNLSEIEAFLISKIDNAKAGVKFGNAGSAKTTGELD